MASFHSRNTMFLLKHLLDLSVNWYILKIYPVPMFTLHASLTIHWPALKVSSLLKVCMFNGNYLRNVNWGTASQLFFKLYSDVPLLLQSFTTGSMASHFIVIKNSSVTDMVHKGARYLWILTHFLHEITNFIDK